LFVKKKTREKQQQQQVDEGKKYMYDRMSV